jgi:hypothetical protein
MLGNGLFSTNVAPAYFREPQSFQQTQPVFIPVLTRDSLVLGMTEQIGPRMWLISSPRFGSRLVLRSNHSG